MSWTYGIHAVETLLKDNPEQIAEVWLLSSRRPGPARQRLRELAENEGVRFRVAKEGAFTRALGDVNHQGVAARVREFDYADATELLALEGPGLILALDEVQDPHNLGAIIRSAAALGARGVVIPRHRAAGVTATVRKVSAGGTERIPVAQVTNLSRFLEDARAANYWNYATMLSDQATPLHKFDFADRAVIVMGSENSGVRKGVLKHCDAQVYLPMRGVQSLNVSVATGVFAYEWVRQMGQNGREF